MLNYNFGERCDHGLRKASCELCELQSENGLLREQVEDLEKDLAYALERIANLQNDISATNEHTLKIVDRCFHAYASAYRIDANNMAEALLRKEREG